MVMICHFWMSGGHIWTIFQWRFITYRWMDITLRWNPSGHNAGTDLRQCKDCDDMACGTWWCKLSERDGCFAHVCKKGKDSPGTDRVSPWITSTAVSHPSITRFYTPGISWTDWFRKSRIFRVKAGLLSLILRLGDMWTQLKTNVHLSPQIIKGCIMNKPR